MSQYSRECARSARFEGECDESELSPGAVTASKAQEHDLIATYHRFVETIVVRLMRSMALPVALKDDFLAAGALGLVEAAGRFDPRRGADFRAFAFLRIRGAVIDHIRASCELTGEAYRMFRALAAAHEVREIEYEAAASGAPVTSHPTAAGRAIEYLSKSAVAFALYGAAVGVEVAGPSTPESELEGKERAKKLRQLVATLPEKERIVIEQHYFHDRSLVEIAEHYAGLSKSWVSRLHDRALKKLRDKLQAERRERPPVAA